MSTGKKYTIAILIVAVFAAIIWLFASGNSDSPPQQKAPAPSMQNTTPKSFAGKTVVWIDSYHKGYAWSDGIEKAIIEKLDDTEVKLVSFRLDSKRHPEEELCKARAIEIKKQVDTLAPDVIIASDDLAQKYIIVPYYRDGTIPVVFCGVNWSADEYGYPTKNVTGMIEVDLVMPLMEHLRRYAKGWRVSYLAFDSLTERKMFNEQNKRFFDGKMKIYMVPEPTFASYKKTFLHAQQKSDMILISNNAGITDWNDAEAEKFFRENTTIPTGGINNWMIGYNLVTFCKLPEEQGEWSASTALKILSGTKVSDIPLAMNKKGTLFINMDIAEKLDIVFPLDILRNAEIYSPKKK